MNVIKFNGARHRTVTSAAVPDVVIVCAEQDIGGEIANWLMMRRMKVAIAADGYEAAQALARGCRRLITDRVLPPWPGLDQFVVLKHRYPSLNIIFIESPKIHDRILACVTGVNVTLSRPLTKRAVLEAFGFV